MVYIVLVLLFVFVGVPLILAVMVGSFVFLDDCAKRRRFSMRDLFVLMTLVAVAFGVVAAALQFANVTE